MDEVEEATAKVLALGQQQRKVTLPAEPFGWYHLETPRCQREKGCVSG